MKFFNKYSKEDNFRWMGFYIFKTAFGLGLSFGKPIWKIPKFTIVINDDDRILKLKFGWLLFCISIEVVHKYISLNGYGFSKSDDTYVSVPPKHVKYVKTKYIYRGKGKPLPYTEDI